MFIFYSFFSVSLLPSSVQGALASNSPLDTKTRNRVLRECTKWCLQNSSRPGEEGLITEIAEKLITRYPKFAGEGENVVQKSVKSYYMQLYY